MGKPKVFLCMPHCGPVHMAAARSFHSYDHAADPRVVDIVTRSEGNDSFLPGNFNEHLARALDARDRGDATHFAMLHSDIAPPELWLSDLYHELIFRNIEVISAVVPIKSREMDLTSTAIGRVDDPWHIVRHLTTAELSELPVTFGTSRVCEPGQLLLINTGCWLADLTASWWDDFEGFDTHCRIVRGETRRTVERRTEDWEFSRFLHSVDARYCATTRISVGHLGTYEWRIR